MDNRKHGEHHAAIKEAVACLGDADGETVETVIKELGMTEQLTRQLVMSGSNWFINMLIEEKQGLERQDMIRRMQYVKQDADAILAHLMDGKPLDGVTEYGVQIRTHLDNITIACELDNNEYKTWKL